MVVRAHVQQHQAERDVAGLDILLHGERIREDGGGLPVHRVPRRLGQEHATHVAAPRRVVVPIELIDGDLGGGILGRGHRDWAHNLLKSEERWAKIRSLKNAEEVYTAK